MQAAVFSDVEGTLVDASIPRLMMIEGRKLGMFSNWQKVQMGALNLVGRLLPGKLRRSLLFVSAVRGMNGQPDAKADRLVAVMLPLLKTKTKPSSLARLQAHQAEGLPLVLVSAGPHEMMQQFGKELGGRGEGTKLVRHDGKFWAKVDGAVCQGEGKADRVRAILTELDIDPAQSYAYGDTMSDVPFLQLFGHPAVVDPDPQLELEAKQRGWPIYRS